MIDTYYIVEIRLWDYANIKYFWDTSGIFGTLQTAKIYYQGIRCSKEDKRIIKIVTKRTIIKTT